MTSPLKPGSVREQLKSSPEAEHWRSPYRDAGVELSHPPASIDSPQSSLGAHIDKRTKHWASAITNVHKIIGGVVGISTMLFLGGRWAVLTIKQGLRENADALAAQLDPMVLRPNKDEADRRAKTGEPMPPTLSDLFKQQADRDKKLEERQLALEKRVDDPANPNSSLGQKLDSIQNSLNVVFGNKPPPRTIGPTATQQGRQ